MEADAKRFPCGGSRRLDAQEESGEGRERRVRQQEAGLWEAGVLAEEFGMTAEAIESQGFIVPLIDEQPVRSDVTLQAA